MNENTLWIERWKNKEIGFNQSEANPFMIKHFASLNLKKGDSILVPLCGKSIDMLWLLAQGYKVRGIELSEEAVIQFFAELGKEAKVSTLGELLCYSSDDIHIYVGDIFKVTAQILGKVDAIYDRASLVALTKDLRIDYAKHLRSITNNAPQLLLCFEYEQSLMNRSPYSVDEEEVKSHYAKHYNVKMLCKEKIVGGFKGKLPASDVVWLLG
ncbi:Thiopurine S-methyltransferase [hydrothermal vent metagenome]|uniref:thiopurine S-methyltransferase n=1 Tax=hydrothermal vent metagenome TaxID=652676 RepID=A0A1W1D1D5_9ZZZZ